MIKIGTKAPGFAIKNEKGNEIKLSDYLGKRIVLYFYPKDNTPGCTAEACSLRDSYSALKKKGIEVIGVSADSEKSHQNFIEKYELPFTLLSDAEKDVLMKYEAWGEKKMYGKTYEGIIRKTIIISPEGIIEHIIEKVDTKNHAQQILDLLAS